MIKKTFVVISLICLTFSSSVFAGGDVSSTADDGLYNPVPTIMPHIADAHEGHLWGEGDNSFSIPLPVILYDNGFKFFMSSEFKHGKKVVTSNENYYRMYYDKNRIYKTDSEGTFIYDDTNKLINEKPIDFSIT